MPESRAPERVGPPRDHVLVTDLDGELTLYDPKRNEVHSLNSTASDIWRLLDGSHSFDEVVDLFAEKHLMDADAVRPYVAQTLSRLVELGLIAGHTEG